MENYICKNCGNTLSEDDKFCPDCGTKKEEVPPKNICPNCGKELPEGSKFCSECGYKLTDSEPVQTETRAKPEALPVVIPIAEAKDSTKPDFNDIKQKMMKSKSTIIAVAAVAIVAIVVLYMINNSGPNFKALYNQYCDSTWAEVGDDGSYLSLDTNPYDEDDNGMAYEEAYDAAEDINEALKLPNSLLEEFGHTTGGDGKQSEDFPDQNVTVQWRYYPDNGLEITYKKLK